MSKLRYKLFAVKDEHLAAYLYSKGCYCADYKDDTFFVMIKKAAVITLRKKLLTFLNLIIFISFVIVLYLIPFLIPFVSFTFFIYILQSINKKTFTTIAREEYERSLLPENLFLPVVKEDEEK